MFLAKLHEILKIKQDGFEKVTRLLLAVAFVAGLLFTFLVPPFQKPDEVVHFYKSISVARGELLCSKHNSDTFQNLLPQYLVDLPTTTFAKHIAFNPQVPFPPGLYPKLIAERKFDTKLINEPSACSLPFVLYIPTGIVLSLPILLKLNPLFIFYLGRLSNFLLAFAIFYLATKITPKKLRTLPLFVLLLPMTLHQMSSYSKDALHLAFGMLGFAYLLRLIESKKVKRKEFLLLLICLTIAILARPQYFLLSLLPLMLLKKKRSKKIARWRFRLLALTFIATLFISLLAAVSLEVYSAKASSLGNVASETNIYPHLQLKSIIEYPLRFPTVIQHTLAKNAEGYSKELIGVLGWLDYEMPWHVYLIYIAFFFLILKEKNKDLPKLSKYQFLMLNAVFWGTLFGLFLAMYLYATPVGGATVDGLQGRYFILLLPLLFWIFAEIIKRLKGKELSVIVFVVFVSVFASVLNRYYSYSHYYYNQRTNEQKQIDQVSLFETEKINIFAQSSIALDQNKKLAGIAAYVWQNEKPVVVPYQLVLKDKDCATVLRSILIDSSTLKNNQWNNFEFEPLDYQNQRELCVQLKPYHIKVEESQSLNFLGFTFYFLFYFLRSGSIYLRNMNFLIRKIGS